MDEAEKGERESSTVLDMQTRPVGFGRFAMWVEASGWVTEADANLHRAEALGNYFTLAGRPLRLVPACSGV